jgi:tetratricopeptide (TPR) repeat protein
MRGGAGLDQAYWRDVIRRGAATFFVGAGISAAPPSSLPLAAGLVGSMIAPVLEPLALSRGLALSITNTLVRLRPEVITDVLLEHLGRGAVRPLLHALRGQPNAWHTFLAAALGAGCSVLTTNFDTLIEQACDASGTHHRTIVGTSATGDEPASATLFKIHGSIGDGVSSVALAVRQVGRGLALGQTTLLRRLAAARPLIVLGYSGRDDFDILPALLDMQRTAPALWVVHESAAPIRSLAGAARRRAQVRPAATCANAWTDSVRIVIGESSEMMEILRPWRTFGRTRVPRAEMSRGPQVPPPDRHVAATAVLYSLVEARAFALAGRLFRHVTASGASARLLVAYAVVLEKLGTDLRAAADVSRRARKACKHEPAMVRALVLDQSGVIARRRGLHGLAVRFYDRALHVATTSRCPGWLVIQIRSHRAVALEYLGRRDEALREQRRVASYEKRTGDLRGYAKSLNNIGIVYMNQSRWRRAIAAFERSCSLKRELGDTRGIAQSLHNLGKLHYLRRDYDAARTTFLESLRLRLGAARDEHGAAQSYVAPAHVAHSAGDRQSAIDHATRALEAHSRFGDQRGITQARGLLRTLTLSSSAGGIGG